MRLRDRLEAIDVDALARLMTDSQRASDVCDALGWTRRNDGRCRANWLRQACTMFGITYRFAPDMQRFSPTRLRVAFAACDSAQEAAAWLGCRRDRYGVPMSGRVKEAAKRQGIAWPYTARDGRRSVKPHRADTHRITTL